jgi:hypothetical protein
LKERLLFNDEISSNIAFSKVRQDDKGCISFYIVYNAPITAGETIGMACKLEKYKYIR